MNHLRNIVCAVLFVGFLPVYADDASSIDVPLQEEDQQSCVHKILDPCIAKCDATVDSNCQDLCTENAKNECRAAGE